MDDPRIITIGDNVCDKYLSRGRMYPGGQCVNISVFSRMNGADTAYLGKFGDDDVARCVIDALAETGVDASHCRRYEGENGFACVTLDGNDRVFLGSNKGGIAKEHAFDFSPDDFDYIKSFDLICTNLNSYIEDDLEVLAEPACLSHSISPPVGQANIWNRFARTPRLRFYLVLICPTRHESRK